MGSVTLVCDNAAPVLPRNAICASVPTGAEFRVPAVHCGNGVVPAPCSCSAAVLAVPVDFGWTER